MKDKNRSSIKYLVAFIIIFVFMGGISLWNAITSDTNIESMESSMLDRFPFKTEFININGAIRNLLGQKEMNGIVKLSNDYLLKPIEYVDDSTLQEVASSVIAFHKYLSDRDIDMVYCLGPYTDSKYDSKLIAGVEDYGNDNADSFLNLLDNAGIDIIDYRQTMYEDGIDQYDMMYKTDHHWNAHAGFYAYKKLEEYIINKTGCTVDDRISDVNQYDIVTYKNKHLGSNGQRTGKYFAGIDDFELYIPDFDIIIENSNGETGTIEDLVYNMEPLLDDNYVPTYTYDFVLERAHESYKNLDSKNDVKILFVADSFGKVVAPFLIMGFGEFNVIRTDYITSMTKEYIESYSPDIVIMMSYSEFATSIERNNFENVIN